MKESWNEKNFKSSSETKTDEYRLILLNDNVNSFDNVIQNLVRICGFDYERAEQCTLLTHLKGKYSIMSGNIHTLTEFHEQLKRNNIQTKIEKK